MKGLTTTILLAVVLAGLGVYIYFYESGEQAGAEAKEKAFAALEADRIEEVQIKAAGGETSHLRRSADGWQLVAPEKAEADASEDGRTQVIDVESGVGAYREPNVWMIHR